MGTQSVPTLTCGPWVVSFCCSFDKDLSLHGPLCVWVVLDLFGPFNRPNTREAEDGEFEASLEYVMRFCLIQIEICSKEPFVVGGT